MTGIAGHDAGMCGHDETEYAVSLLFRRHDGISATLEIQPLLENGRRPDFRLQFNSAEVKAAAAAIVLDAKFRTRWHRGALSALLTELVESKGYGLRGDRVFILQPQRGAVSEPTSPLIWGRHCDYGQDAPANHRRGMIQLAAGAQRGGTLNNLRRLIAMELQVIFPAPASDRSAETGTTESFCIRCGTTHAPGNIEHRTTKRGKDFWRLSCNQCSMLTVRTHCYDCGKSLFKNGTDLTYHRTLADQITNVVCYQCGAFFDQDTMAAEARSTR
jgi:RNase P subunit RPR2